MDAESGTRVSNFHTTGETRDERGEGSAGGASDRPRISSPPRGGAEVKGDSTWLKIPGHEAWSDIQHLSLSLSLASLARAHISSYGNASAIRRDIAAMYCVDCPSRRNDSIESIFLARICRPCGSSIWTKPNAPCTLFRSVGHRRLLLRLRAVTRTRERSSRKDEALENIDKDRKRSLVSVSGA